MKKTRISVLAALSALSVTLWSCASGITGDMEPVQDTHAVAKMNLRITGNGSTRSSISPDEGLIENICVMAYGQKDGMLADIADRKFCRRNRDGAYQRNIQYICDREYGDIQRSCQGK